MKIIDENGSVVEKPDLTAGYLAADTEAVEHPAQDAVEELSHYETVAEYPNGGKDVRKVIDRAAVPAAPAWTEQVPIQRYIRYTAEELARREKEQQEARQQQEALDKLPQTLEALQEDNKTLKKENEMLKQCLLEMSEIVYA
jgi:hypothetical protein|nr:MAG TPA: Short coiled-coil protein [Caudoviricetes sp.]